MTQDILDIYTDYLSQNHQATATWLSSLLDGGLSHDKITRFLNHNSFTSKDLWHYVKAAVRKAEKTEGVLI